MLPWKIIARGFNNISTEAVEMIVDNFKIRFAEKLLFATPQF
jgi:hypothetical protein